MWTIAGVNKQFLSLNSSVWSKVSNQSNSSKIVCCYFKHCPGSIYWAWFIIIYDFLFHVFLHSNARKISLPSILSLNHISQAYLNGAHNLLTNSTNIQLLLWVRPYFRHWKYSRKCNTVLVITNLSLWRRLKTINE